MLLLVVSDKLQRLDPVPCSGHQFQCGDGSCIHISFACDGEPDCPDALDEDPKECRQKGMCALCISLKLKSTTAQALCASVFFLRFGLISFWWSGCVERSLVSFFLSIPADNSVRHFVFKFYHSRDFLSKCNDMKWMEMMLRLKRKHFFWGEWRNYVQTRILGKIRLKVQSVAKRSQCQTEQTWTEWCCVFFFGEGISLSMTHFSDRFQF